MFMLGGEGGGGHAREGRGEKYQAGRVGVGGLEGSEAVNPTHCVQTGP